MISNQILQSTIDGLKGITRIDISVMDTDGKVLASTADNPEQYENIVLSFVASPADSQAIQDTNSLRCLMSINLNMLLWQRVIVKMYL